MKTIKVKDQKVQKIVLAFILVIIFAQAYHAFFSNYKLRSPILFQSPIVERYISPLPKGIRVIEISPTPTYAPTRRVSPTPSISRPKAKKQAFVDVNKIYQLESSGGRNDGCRREGKFNGYGFGQSSFAWNCFNSYEEVTNKVIAWFEDKMHKGFSKEEALCYYNKGIKTSDCSYVQAYNSL